MCAVRVYVHLTCSSASKSWLYCAISSVGLFFSRLRHSSQVPRPAMNMPMSGRNTRMPFPTSAPITLIGKDTGNQSMTFIPSSSDWTITIIETLTIHDHNIASKVPMIQASIQYIIGNSQTMCSKDTNTHMKPY